jgi:tRNA(Ile)-lysidine synthase
VSHSHLSAPPAGAQAFCDAVLKTIRAHRMFEPGDRVLVGVSGGIDSMALLHFLWIHADALGIFVVAGHVNHRIRGEAAEADQAFVTRWCADRGIPVLTAAADVPRMAQKRKISLETAGRLARRRCFERWQRQAGAAKIALAHHLDDQAETVLMHLIRGAGIRGAAGMRPVAGAFVRPFLQVRREAIEAYAAAWQLPHVEDATNASDAFMRNRLRHQVMPVLTACNARAVAHIGAFAEQAAAWRDAQQAILEAARERCVTPTDRGIEVSLPEWRALPGAVQGALLNWVMAEAARTAVDFEARHVRLLQEKLAAPATTWDLDLPHRLKARRRYDRLIFSRGGQPRPFRGVYVLRRSQRIYDSASGFCFQVQIETAEGSKGTKNCHKRKFVNEIAFDYGKIRSDLVLRGRDPKDQVVLAGVGRQRLKKFLMARRIDRDLRDTLPILAEDNRVVAVLGLYQDPAYRVSDQTQVKCTLRWEKIVAG